MRRFVALADFVALYRGRTVSESEIVAVSAEPRLVRRFFAELLGEPETAEETPKDEACALTTLKLVETSEK
jgi:hypothetical protein